MLLRPQIDDLKVIGFYTGKIVIGIGLLMLIPLVFSLLVSEFNPAFDFVISVSVCFIAGFALLILCYCERDLKWMHGMVVVSLSWLAAMLVGAIPLYLSGHYLSYLDSCFEAMSGFATCGLTLVQKLDHLSLTHNMWRHLMMYIGGQGITVVALTFFIRGATGAFRIYVGEAREERVLPNVIQTARFIWLVSLVYLVLGTAVLAAIARGIGISPKMAVLHGIWVCIAAWDTGGFAPQSQNILYYHSWIFETATIVMMVMGSLNFKLHYALWNGNRKEILRNIEMITFFISMVVLFSLVSTGLARAGVYPDKISLFRRGFYQLISGHTGTGYMTIYARQFIHEWGGVALLSVSVAMGLGAGACSTCGGIKVLRVGIIFKAIVEDIKRLIMPESSIIIQKFHHIRDLILEEKQVRSAAIVMIAFIFLYCLGALFGVLAGYSLQESMFESISAAANVGLSCGITAPSMPNSLKVVYILEMWAGRLEFLSVFTLAGFFVALIRGR